MLLLTTRGPRTVIACCNTPLNCNDYTLSQIKANIMVTRCIDQTFGLVIVNKFAVISYSKSEYCVYLNRSLGINNIILNALN